MSADRDPGSVNEKSWRNVMASVWHLAYTLIRQGSVAPGPVHRQHVLFVQQEKVLCVYMFFSEPQHLIEQIKINMIVTLCDVVEGTLGLVKRYLEQFTSVEPKLKSCI